MKSFNLTAPIIAKYNPPTNPSPSDALNTQQIGSKQSPQQHLLDKIYILNILKNIRMNSTSSLHFPWSAYYYITILLYNYITAHVHTTATATNEK